MRPSLPQPQPEDDPADIWSGGELLDVTGWVREAPPFLVSAVLHMSAVLLILLIHFSTAPKHEVTLDATFSEEIGDQLIDDNLLEAAPEELAADFESLAPEAVEEVMDPFSEAMKLPEPTAGESGALSGEALAPGVALSGREPGLKRALLGAFGGDQSTQTAVKKGLLWLQRNQRTSNKLWSLMGPYKKAARSENQEAATAMALLAFQGDGHTHKSPRSDPFARTVADGLRSLRRSQNKKTGEFFREGAFNQRYYTHALCSIVLCEAYGMTQDPELLPDAQSAINYLIETQSDGGGWRYDPGDAADVSVTGWCVMALKSAQIAGISVPTEAFARIGKFLDSAQHDGGAQYGYQARGTPRISMTAEGLLCRQYLGWRQDDPRLLRGAEVLLGELPQWRTGRKNAYYWYYGAQFCHHMEGRIWEEWNYAMKEVVPKHQETRGRDVGSWDPAIDEMHGGSGGRLYTTCLCIYMMEVYYRHLPLYRQQLLLGK